MQANKENAPPVGWKVERLGDIAKINPQKEKLEWKGNQACSFIPMASVSETEQAVVEVLDEPFSKVSKGYTQFQEGDIIFAKITPCMENGKVAIVQKLKNGYGYGSTEFFVFRVDDPVTRQFIFRLVASAYFRSIAATKMKGAVGQLRVPKDFLEDYSVLLPPHDEQKRIVARLDSMLGKIKEARKLIEEAKESFKDRRAAILAKAFRGELTAKWREENPDVERVTLEVIANGESRFHIPPNWLWVRIGQICEVKGGKRLPLGEELVNHNTGYPYIRARDLKQGTVIPDKIKYIEKSVQQQIKSYTISSDDAYITIVGAKIGDAGTVPTGFNGANLTENAAKLTNFRGTYNEYVSLWLQSPTGQANIKENILSAAQGKLALTRIRDGISMPMPPIKEQEKIVMTIRALLALHEQPAEILEMEEHLDLLEKSILSKAFWGGLH